MSIILHYLNLRNRTLNSNCDVFRAAALDTWHRILFSRTKPKLKIHETTITQNLIYELNLLKEIFTPINYQIFESIDESANGDDLEISIKKANGRFITFAIQAKIIYHSLPSGRRGYKRLDDGIYSQFKHYVGKGRRRKNQIDLLLEHAKRNGYISLYLLYNFVNDKFETKNLCDVEYNITQYGCSIVSAQYLKDNYSIADGNLFHRVRFTDLHPDVGLPWFVLTCCFPNYTTRQIFDSLNSIGAEYEVNEFSVNDVIDYNQWLLISESTVSQTNERRFVKASSDAKIQFNPKYKLLIN